MMMLWKRCSSGRQRAPSMVVLEDIDRAFPRNQSSGARSQVSFQQLLNCLDGIGTQDRVVVVPTANEPTAPVSGLMAPRSGQELQVSEVRQERPAYDAPM